MVLSVALFGCNSNVSNTALKEKVKKFAWQQEVSCVRNDTTQKATITAANMPLTVNKNGCYGGDQRLCDVRMYQIMTESFMHSDKGASGYKYSWGPSKHNGNLRGVIDNLDYIKSTGSNTIWLTPIFASYEIPGQEPTYDKLDGTGYFTSDYFTIDPKFGTKEDLKELVNKAHAKGMYVMLDGVFGHAKTNVKTVSPQGHTLVLNRQCREIKDYYEKMSLRLGTCFDTEKSMDFLKDVATYWIKEAKIDGWRLDQAYQVPPKYWKELTKAVVEESAKPANAYKVNGKKVQPLGYMVGELWSDYPADLENNGFKDEALMSAFNFPMRAQLMKVMAVRGDTCSQPASSLDEGMKKLRGYTKPGITNMFITNHDVVRFGDLLQRAKYEEDGKNGDSYYQAHQAVLSFLAAFSGPITIYYGDEYGDDLAGFVNQPSSCGDVDRCDDHVSRTDGRVASLNEKEKQLKNEVAQMLSLRDSHKALSRGERTHMFSDSTLYVDLKHYKNDNVVYVLNVGTGDRTLEIKPEVWGKLGLGSCTMTNLLTKQSADASDLKIKGLSGNFYGLSCK